MVPRLPLLRFMSLVKITCRRNDLHHSLEGEKAEWELPKMSSKRI